MATGKSKEERGAGLENLCTGGGGFCVASQVELSEFAYVWSSIPSRWVAASSPSCLCDGRVESGGPAAFRSVLQRERLLT